MGLYIEKSTPTVYTVSKGIVIISVAVLIIQINPSNIKL